MRQSNLMLVAVIVTALASGCAQRVVSESGGDVAVSGATGGWGGSFRGRDGWSSTRGSVFARPVEGGTQVALTVEGGIPGSRYGWEVREGQCGTNARLVGEVAAYTPVSLGNQGMGSSIAVLPVQFDTGKQYSVNLFADVSERTLVIGCGSLTR